MKKSLKSLALAFLLVSLASFDIKAAEPKFYVGADYRLVDLDFSNGSADGISIETNDYYESNSKAIALFAGYQFNNSGAVEVSYLSSNSKKDNDNTGLVWNETGDDVTTKSTINYKLFSTDYVHSYKLRSYPIKLLAIVGLSALDLEINEYYNNNSKNSYDSLKYGVNVGFGAEFDINKNISLVTKAKYTKFLNDKLENVYGAASLDAAKILSVGVKVKF